MEGVQRGRRHGRAGGRPPPGLAPRAPARRSAPTRSSDRWSSSTEAAARGLRRRLRHPYPAVRVHQPRGRAPPLGGRRRARRASARSSRPGATSCAATGASSTASGSPGTTASSSSTRRRRRRSQAGAWPSWPPRPAARARDVVFDVLAAHADRVDGPMCIGWSYTVDQIAEAAAHPRCSPSSDATTLSPAGPLAPSRLPRRVHLGRLVPRDRSSASARAVPIEAAIHRLTGLPASADRPRGPGRRAGRRGGRPRGVRPGRGPRDGDVRGAEPAGRRDAPRRDQRRLRRWRTAAHRRARPGGRSGDDGQGDMPDATATPRPTPSASRSSATP